jgi:predicted transcriptional regulator of viral defense system
MDDDNAERGHAYLERAFSVVASLGRPSTVRELEGLGVNRVSLSQLAACGRIERLARGVYHVPTMADDPRILWAALSLSYECVFCLMSAASFHGLTEESPGSLDVGIPKRARTPITTIDVDVAYHPWSADEMEVAVETMEIEGAEVRITSPARTIVDLYRHSTYNRDLATRPLVSDTTFVDALSRFLDDGDQNRRGADLRQVAKAFGVWERISELMAVIQMTRDRGMSR